MCTFINLLYLTSWKYKNYRRPFLSYVQIKDDFRQAGRAGIQSIWFQSVDVTYCLSEQSTRGLHHSKAAQPNQIAPVGNRWILGPQWIRGLDDGASREHSHSAIKGWTVARRRSSALSSQSPGRRNYRDTSRELGCLSGTRFYLQTREGRKEKNI